jgi:hypothetical protein
MTKCKQLTLIANRQLEQAARVGWIIRKAQCQCLNQHLLMCCHLGKKQCSDTKTLIYNHSKHLNHSSSKQCSNINSLLLKVLTNKAIWYRIGHCAVHLWRRTTNLSILVELTVEEATTHISLRACLTSTLEMTD